MKDVEGPPGITQNVRIDLLQRTKCHGSFVASTCINALHQVDNKHCSVKSITIILWFFWASYKSADYSETQQLSIFSIKYPWSLAASDEYQICKTWCQHHLSWGNYTTEVNLVVVKMCRQQYECYPWILFWVLLKYMSKLKSLSYYLWSAQIWEFYLN